MSDEEIEKLGSRVLTQLQCPQSKQMPTSKSISLEGI